MAHGPGVVGQDHVQTQIVDSGGGLFSTQNPIENCSTPLVENATLCSFEF